MSATPPDRDEIRRRHSFKATKGGEWADLIGGTLMTGLIGGGFLTVPLAFFLSGRDGSGLGAIYVTSAVLLGGGYFLFLGLPVFEGASREIAKREAYVEAVYAEETRQYQAAEKRRADELAKKLADARRAEEARRKWEEEAPAREAAEKAQMLENNRQLHELTLKMLQSVYACRYIILSCQMLPVLFAVYGSFKLRMAAELGALSETDLKRMFAEAFPYTDLAGDWRTGALRHASNGKDDLCFHLRNVLPPDPEWIMEGKDPYGYWKNNGNPYDKIVQDVEAFIAANPDWYKRGLLLPGMEDNFTVAHAASWYKEEAERLKH